MDDTFSASGLEEELPEPDGELPAISEEEPFFSVPDDLTEETDASAFFDDDTVQIPADSASEDFSSAGFAEVPYEEPAEKAYPEEPFEDTAYPPTVVPRPPQEKRSKGRTALRVFKIIGKYLLAIVLIVAILAAGLFGYLTVAEYNPAHAEIAEPGAVSISTPLHSGDYRIVTFNTGYGGLGESADFFMDGGKGVTPESEQFVKGNMLGIENIIEPCDADFIFLQEVDTDSKRSYEQNQWLQYEYDFADYESRFAANYSCDYVPYPLPETIGKVHSGIVTFSRYNIASATRYSLPCPFSWPTRIANLKRCMLVTRIPLDGREQELVLVNFHLEAYDDGEGKLAQTEQLMSFVQEEYAKGNFVIAGGDFNQTFPGARDIYPMKDTTEWIPGELDELPANWRYAYDTVVPTCRLLNQPFNPASDLTQFYIIDGFLVSPNVIVNRVEALDEGFVYSDHNPVVMDFTLSFEAQSESAEEAG